MDNTGETIAIDRATWERLSKLVLEIDAKLKEPGHRREPDLNIMFVRGAAWLVQYFGFSDFRVETCSSI